MAVVKNDAYHFGLEFAVESFIQAGVQTFSTTSLHEAVRIREIDKQVNIFLMNPSIEFETLKAHNIAMTLPSLTFYHEHIEDLAGVKLHLELENLLHRSGLKDQDEMLQVLKTMKAYLLQSKQLLKVYGHISDMQMNLVAMNMKQKDKHGLIAYHLY